MFIIYFEANPPMRFILLFPNLFFSQKRSEDSTFVNSTKVKSRFFCDTHVSHPAVNMEGVQVVLQFCAH